MKRNQNSKTAAFSLVELLVILAVIGVFVLLGISAQARTSIKGVRVTCANNLRQIALAFRIWEGGNGSHFPQFYAGNSQYPAIDSANGVSSGFNWPGPGSTCPNMFTVFEVMSNELNNPKVMVCPADERIAATNFTTDFYLGANALKNTRCSYFVGRDASESFPQMFLAGDRNIGSDTAQSPTMTSGSYSQFGFTTVAAPGYVAAIGTNQIFAPLSSPNFGWNARIHLSGGNVAMADGSVQLLSTPALKSAFGHSGDTNSSGNVLLFP